MGEPCINKKCGAYEKDEDYNCGHIILDDPTKCRCYLTIKTASGSKVPCSVGLDAPVVAEEMLIRAMRKAVDVGLIPKWADEELYLKNWDGMKKVLQAAVGN